MILLYRVFFLLEMELMNVVREVDVEHVTQMGGSDSAITKLRCVLISLKHVKIFFLLEFRLTIKK